MGGLMGGEVESITEKCTWTEDHPGEDFIKPGDRLGILVDMRQGGHVLVQFSKNFTLVGDFRQRLRKRAAPSPH